MTAATAAQDDDSLNGMITVGRLIHVQPRTWPGINKPGGVARVIRVHYNNNNKPGHISSAISTGAEDGDINTSSTTIDENPSHVDVKYVLGTSREKMVPVEYVRLAPEFEEHVETTRTNIMLSSTSTSESSNLGRSFPAGVEMVPARTRSLRDRSTLQGRCTRCGSLRVDCGSCDWATEDVAGPMKRTYRNAGGTSMKSIPGRNIDYDDDNDVSISNDNSSDSDDDQDLQELKQLLEEARRRRQIFRRKRRRWKRAPLSRRMPVLGECGSRQNCATDSVPTMSYADPDPRAAVNPRRGLGLSEKDSKGRRHSGTKKIQKQIMRDFHLAHDSINPGNEKSRRGEIDTHWGKKTRKYRLQSRSILETLGTGQNEDGKTCPRSLPIHDHESDQGKLEENNDLKTGRSEGSSETDDSDEDEYRSHSDPPPMLSVATPEQSEGMYQALAKRAVQRVNLRSREKDDAYDLASFPPEGFEASEFIQPEGEEAVENLPEDIVDLTKDMPYFELAPFFDSLASQLENERLPDSKLRLSQLQKELQQITSQNLSGGETDDRTSPIQLLLDRCGRTWENIRQSLIRCGTDQCRAALRRLDNDRLYRKEKKHLTPDQRKMSRGLGVMDYRQLRMDSLNEAVDDLCKQLKHIVDHCESFTIDNIIEDNDGENSVSYSVATSGESSNAMDDSFAFFDDDSHPSKRNDPTHEPPISLEIHPHAHRKRQFGHDEPCAHSSSKSADRADKSSQLVAKRRKIGLKTSVGDKTLHTNENRKKQISDFNSAGSSEAEKKDQKRKSHRQPRRFESSKGKKDDSQNIIFASFVEPHRARDSIPISQRMQDWFDAQDTMSETEQQYSENDESDSQLNESTLHRSKWESAGGLSSSFARMQNRTGATAPSRRNSKASFHNDRFGEQQSIDDDQQNSANGHVDELGEPPRELCQNLLTYSRLQCVSRPHGNLMTANQACQSLERMYFESSIECLAALFVIEGGLSSNGLASVFLKAARNILLHSPTTLQEVLATDQKRFETHVQLLAVCLRSFEENKEDSSLPSVFQKQNRRRFLDLLVLQFVDVMYATFLPSGWGNISHDESVVLRQLLPLRDALARCMPLVESVCLFIEQRLELQQWALDLSEQRIFITSVKPVEWKECIETSRIVSGKTMDIRLKKLGNVWPDIEAVVLWKIMAFVSSSLSPSTVMVNSDSRWRMISRIFLCTILSQENAKGQRSLRPSREQLAKCESHFDCLLSLLHSDAMGPVPDDDAILTTLIRRVLKLEGDAFSGNVLSWEREIHDSNKTKFVSQLWRASHPSFFDSIEFCNNPLTIDTLIKDKDEPSSTLLSRLLGPMPGVLQRSLYFICMYARRLPRKAVRLNRFDKSLAMIQAFLLKEASEEKSVDKPECPASFEEAFNSTPAREETCYMLHAFAKISMIRCMLRDIMVDYTGSTEGNEDTEHLHTRVWQSMAAPDTKKRQEAILLGFASQANSPLCGGEYRLIEAAKAMSSALCVQMNLSPWFPSDKQTSKLLHKTVDTDGTNVAFIISCIFACLDCLCDLHLVDSILSQIYRPLITSFLRLILCVKSGRRCSGIEHLKSLSMSRFGPVLHRCLQRHMASNDVSNDGRISFRLFLTLIRSMQSLLVTKAPSPQQSPVTTMKSGPSEDEDLWGSIDDEDLLALDLDEPYQSKKAIPEKNDGSIWIALSKAVKASMPSERFSVSHQRPNGPLTTPLGKDRIAKEVRRIVECIALNIAANGSSDSDSSAALLWTNQSLVNNEDTAFCSEVAQYLTRELCSLYLTPLFKKNRVSATDSEAFLTSFLLSLFDASRLDLLPTSNLPRIQEEHGDEVLEQASMLLDLFNDTTGHGSVEWIQARQRQRRNRETAFKIWSFAKDIKSLFSRPGCKSYDLMCSKIPIPNHSQLLEASIESETLLIFGTVQRLIVITKDQGDVSLFERFSSLVLFLVSKSVLKVIEGIQYNNQNQIDVERHFRLAKLGECLVCYMELFISIAAWMILESPKSCSDQWALMVALLRDKFCMPLLRRVEDIDITAFFLKVILEAETALGHNGTQAASYLSSSIFKARTVYSNDFFGMNLFGSIIRRSRQFILSTFLNEQNRSLQMALVDALLKSGSTEDSEIANIIGFSLGANWRSPLKFFSSVSQLAQDLDDYIARVDNQFVMGRSIDRLQLEKLSNGKMLFLETYVLPSLTHAHTALAKKRKLLSLLACAISSGFLSKLETLSTDFICLIVRAISTTLHQSLISPNVDDSLLAAAFVCGRHLSTTFVTGWVSTSSEPQAAVTYFSSEIAQLKGKSMVELTVSETKAAYTWCFFHWIFGLAKAVGRPSHLMEDRPFKTGLADIQKTWREHGSDGRAGEIDEEPLDFSNLSQPFEAWDRLLVDLGGILYPRVMSSSIPSSSINVYQQCNTKIKEVQWQQEQSNGCEDAGLNNHSPSAVAQRGAKELIATLILLI